MKRLLLGLGLISILPNYALANTAGSVCAEGGLTSRGGDATGGVTLICNGSNWVQVFEYDINGNISFALPTADDHGATKKYVDDQISGASGGLWTDSSGNATFTTGNVGIGTTTPDRSLVVQGDDLTQVDIISYGLETSPSNGAVLRFHGAGGSAAAPTATQQGDHLGWITFRPHDGTSFLSSSASITARAAENTTSSSKGADLHFLTNAIGSTTNNYNMVLTHNGSLGIGTTTPQSRLDVSGSVMVRNNVNGYALFAPASGTDPWVNYDRFEILVDTSNPVTFIGNVNNGTGETRDLALMAAGEKVRITASGEVGIGTISPTAKLHIKGTTLITDNDESHSIHIIPGHAVDNSHIYSAESISLKLYDGSTNHFTHFDNNGNTGLGTTTPAAKLHVIGNAIISGAVSATSVHNTSDRTLKENITPLENALENVSKLEGVHFTFKENAENTMPQGKQVGLIAQDVKAIYPEVVAGEEGNMAVNYAALIAPLIEAVKELKIENEALKTRIELLENKIN